MFDRFKQFSIPTLRTHVSFGMFIFFCLPIPWNVSQQNPNKPVKGLNLGKFPTKI